MAPSRAVPVRGRRRERGMSIAPYILILPSLLMALWIIGYPIWDLTDMSLHSVTRFGQLKDYSGFANFSKLIAEPLFFECLIRTLVWTFAVVGGTVLLSIPIALILADDFIGRQVLRVIIMLPWAVSLTMSGIVWRWALNGQSGMVNATLYDFERFGSRSPGSPRPAPPFRSRSRSEFSFRSRSRSRYFWAAYPHSLARYSRPPASTAPAAGSAGGFSLSR